MHSHPGKVSNTQALENRSACNLHVTLNNYV